VNLQKALPQPLHAWTMAVRLRTIPIPTIQVFVGTGLAYAMTGRIDAMMALFTWLIALLITIGTNLINDAVDFEKGGDLPQRFGQLKVISAGLLSKEQVYWGGLLAFLAAIGFSIPLALHSGVILYFVVILSACCGYCYTAGPYPICYLGLSEVFIFVFYGGVCVLATYFVQTGTINLPAVLCAAQMGMLAILPNALNNLRDIFEDAEVNKKTLAVRFGRNFARREIAAMTFAPFAINLLWLYFGFLPAALMPLLLLPLAFLFVRSVWVTEPGPIFNRYFGLSVLVHFLFGLLLIVGFIS
jgi:1,4-dihydroxy-2-naphthoate octaprenyltransferase